MERELYIKKQAQELYRLCQKRRKLSSKDLFLMTPKAAQKHSAELNWLGMDISKTEERIGFALGLLTIEQLREFYEPSGWHKYDGIKCEMMRIKFD